MNVRLVLVGLLLLHFVACRPPSLEPVSPLVGKPASDFTAPLFNGESFRLSEKYPEQIIMLDFWATWCGPCRVELPVLISIAEEYKDRGVALYTVNVGEDVDTIREFLADSNSAMNVVLDSEGRIAKTYGVAGIPFLAIIDRQGIVRIVHAGYRDDLDQRLRSELDQLLIAPSEPTQSKLVSE